MKPNCPYCNTDSQSVHIQGRYYRISDSKWIKKYKCTKCFRHFSQAWFSSCYQQKKRRLNPHIKKLLCSSVSMRRIAKLHGISRTTVQRKLVFLAEQARASHRKWLANNKIKFQHVQFDDLETFEHTKCKPLSVTLLVSNKNRKILGFTVAKIPAKGKLATISKLKYGHRENESIKKRDALFAEIKNQIHPFATIQSDCNPYYVPTVKKYFPNSSHERFQSVRSASIGYGELKKIGYDPLFSINHTLAMLRANISRLLRKTWCTTKKVEALTNHIDIYVSFHNQILT